MRIIRNEDCEERWEHKKSQVVNKITVYAEPDKSMTIRQIYDAWAHGRPTSVHPFDVAFDDNADDIDLENENPIDMSQVENDVQVVQAEINSQKSKAKEKAKAKAQKQKDEDSFIEKLANAIKPS